MLADVVSDESSPMASLDGDAARCLDDLALGFLKTAGSAMFVVVLVQ